MSETITLPAPQAPDESPTLAARTALAQLLGLAEPVPERVLEAALHDESYANSLLGSRRNAVMLQHLLDAPPAPADAAPPSLLVLARRATLALARWARTGFATVDTAQLQRRQAACRACPHRQAPQEAAIRAGFGELGTCGLCGCPLARKTRMASEHCPATDPARTGLTRWGEAERATA